MTTILSQIMWPLYCLRSCFSQPEKEHILRLPYTLMIMIRDDTRKRTYGRSYLMSFQIHPFPQTQRSELSVTTDLLPALRAKFYAILTFSHRHFIHSLNIRFLSRNTGSSHDVIATSQCTWQALSQLYNA